MNKPNEMIEMKWNDMCFWEPHLQKKSCPAPLRKKWRTKWNEWYKIRSVECSGTNTPSKNKVRILQRILFTNSPNWDWVIFEHASNEMEWNEMRKNLYTPVKNEITRMQWMKWNEMEWNEILGATPWYSRWKIFSRKSYPTLYSRTNPTKKYFVSVIILVRNKNISYQNFGDRPVRKRYLHIFGASSPWIYHQIFFIFLGIFMLWSSANANDNGKQ